MTRMVEAVAKEVLETVANIEQKEIDLAVERIIGSKRIFCAGCGRSGLIMRTLAMRLMHM